ncbi:MAG: glycosyltransferase [Verrucomicrobia bacterium]|nr:glycosyltransferase [Verrucomicrobiota bacterium]
MNILFVNYGDFTTNSLNHIGGFANTLCAAGQACAVVVPQGKETLAHILNPLFIAATYDEALARPALFPNSQPADVIHAWTPREGVRKFTVAYQRAAHTPARVLVHLEDNERFLLETYTGKTFAELRDASAAELDAALSDSLPHPLRHESFLRVADGVTHIVDRLREFVPTGVPTHLLLPGVDFSLYRAQPAKPPGPGTAKRNAGLRAEIGLGSDEKLIVFTGSNTFANEPEMRELYLAVALLNQRGTPTRLVRTGLNSPRFLDGLSADVRQHVLDLGFIEKPRLPKLLALADVLVQPGHAGAFNDYRLPSKLPEFLAVGKPVALPPTNIATLMEDGREAVFLPTGSPAEIADTCQRLFADLQLGAKLGRNAAAFARQHFDLAANTRALAEFYAATLARPPAVDWSLAQDPTASEATLFAARVERTAESLGPTAAALAAETDLLAHIVRQLEQTIETNAVQRAAIVEAERDAILDRERLTLQHAANLENLLAAARVHAEGLEKSRDLTEGHAANLAKEVTRLEKLHAASMAEEVARHAALLAATHAHASELEKSRDLTRTHADNLAKELAQLEEVLAAARENTTALEQSRDLTQAHADNLAKEVSRLEKLHADSMGEEVARHEALLAAARAHASGLEQSRALTQAHADNLAKEIARLEEQLAAARAHASELEHSRDLTRAHADNMAREIAKLEEVLAAARENISGLEQSRAMTQTHADNMAKELAKQKQRREQADVLLRTARTQVTAYENALLAADADIGSLKGTIENTLEEFRVHRANAAAELAAVRDTLAAARADIAALQAAHAAELAAAADRLAQTQALLHSRETKIANMQSSFSWQATAPFRAARRALFDKPAPPALSGRLLGNIDYPHDWGMIPPTLNVRGWSLHKDRIPLRAIRARLGDRSVPAEFGLERLDVLDHFRDFPGAERSGWIVKIDVPRFGRHNFVIEAQDESGTWHVVHARQIKRTAEAPPPPPNSYAAWVAAYDTLTPDDADRIRRKLSGLTKRPLISVLMPTYNTPERWLVRVIESVRRQLYDNWELCIADDASKEPHVRKVLDRYQKKDLRIKVVYRETNGHISAASNSALALAHGEFIALLDHDDEIRPHALACVALELDAHPNADLVYSDEDKIDENGHRYDQYFKPDWNPDLFLVQNYVSHLGVYRTLLVREVGGFRVGYEGSQDWDLAMRLVERTAPDRIRHIPKILYHWRSVPGSTAMLIGAKNYAVVASEKVISEHFSRLGVSASISPTKGSYWRVRYPLPEPAPLVTLIIPTRNRLGVLQPCIESLREKTLYPNFEILIVDNDSDDPGTLAYLRELEAVGASLDDARGVPDEPAASSDAPAKPPRVRVVHFPGEFNFSALNNFGVSQTDAPVVGLLNNDLEVINGDWLEEMVSHALRPEIGCVGAKLYYPDDRIQHAGVILGIGGVAAHAWQTHPRGAAGQAHRNLLQQNLSAVTAACLVIRRETYQQVGGLEEEKLKVAFNDVDFCLKVRAAGFRNFWTPYAELYHHESASRGAEDTLEKRDRFRSEVEYMTAKWGDALVNDPAYNPNLTLTINDFTLALPPRPWPPLA